MAMTLKIDKIQLLCAGCGRNRLAVDMVLFVAVCTM